MKSINIIKKDEYVDSFDNVYKDTKTMLIVAENGLEVIRNTIHKGCTGIVPPIDNNTIEVYYILEGSLSIFYKGKDVIVGKGDTFVLRSYKKSLPYTILEDVTMIISTNSLEFNKHKDIIKQLNQFMDYLDQSPLQERQHVTRIAKIVEKMLQYIPLDDEGKDNLYYAIQYHDIGKCKVNHELLNKKDLNTQEINRLQQHPLLAYNYIVRYFGEAVANIILLHHEHVDGTGFPYGLENDDICIEARILAVANKYDNLVSRKHIDKDTALTMIMDKSGSYYDQDCVTALIKAVKDDE